MECGKIRGLSPLSAHTRLHATARRRGLAHSSQYPLIILHHHLPVAAGSSDLTTVRRLEIQVNSEDLLIRDLGHVSCPPHTPLPTSPLSRPETRASRGHEHFPVGWGEEKEEETAGPHPSPLLPHDASHRSPSNAFACLFVDPGPSAHPKPDRAQDERLKPTLLQRPRHIT